MLEAKRKEAETITELEMMGMPETIATNQYKHEDIESEKMTTFANICAKHVPKLGPRQRGRNLSPHAPDGAIQFNFG